MEKAFNLLYESWIQVTRNGTEEIVSILGLLSEAHNLRELAGETETQNVAMLRLLLGVLYPVFTREEYGLGYSFEEDFDTKQLWKELWEAGKFPMDKIEKYIKQYEDRFWLKHPEHPFWQTGDFSKQTMCTAIEYTIPGKQGRNGEPDRPKQRVLNEVTIVPRADTLDKLSGYVVNPANIFGTRRTVSSMSLDEAARWLVCANSFDTSFSGGNPNTGVRVSGYKQPYPSYLSNVWLQGKNLFETLLLNLVLESPYGNWEYSKAWWEDVFPCKTAQDLVNIYAPIPLGVVEHMTKQYRYSRLLFNEDVSSVVGYEVWSGVMYTKDGKKGDMCTYIMAEQMAPYITTKKEGRIPSKITSSQMWRDMSALLVQKSNENVDAPGVIRWMASLSNILELELVRVCTLNVKYKNATAVKSVKSDSLSINYSVLAELREEKQKCLPNVVAVTQSMINVYGNLAAELMLARGVIKTSGKAAIKAKETIYFKLDRAFRVWLLSFNTDDVDSIDLKTTEWFTYVKSFLLKEGEDLAAESGAYAKIGREVKLDEKEKEFYSTASSYFTFKCELSKVYNNNTVKERR